MEPPQKKGSKKSSNEKKAKNKLPTTRNDSGATESVVKPQRLTENNWNPGKFREVYQRLQKTRSSKRKTLCRNERRASEILRQCWQNARKGNDRASPKGTHGSKIKAASNMHRDVQAARQYSPKRVPRSQRCREHWPQKMNVTAECCGRAACR